MGKGALKGFIPDMATGINTDPGCSQRKAMYNDDTKAGNSFAMAVPLKGILLGIWQPFAHRQTAVPKLSYFDKYVFIVRIPPSV